LSRIWSACRQAWDFFASTFLAVILLIVLAAVSILGTIIPQNESPQVYQKLYGEVFSQLFYGLGLTSLFGSFFFKILLTILAISLFSCSLRRLILALRGKLNFYLWGSFLAHLAVLVIYLGVIYGGWAGFSYSTGIEKGSTLIERHGNFSLRLNDFNAKFDERGRPLLFSSDLSVFESGKEVLRKTISVNDPLAYRGIKFYQSSYGLNGILEVSFPGKKAQKVPIYKGSCAVFSETGQMFHIEELLPSVDFFHGKAISVYEPSQPVAYVIAHNNESSQEIGWLLSGRALPWGKYSLKLVAAREYTGLQVKKDPGVAVVYLGFFLLTAGIVMMLYRKS
jgi:cytochrome c biogenesis protein